MGIVTIAVIVFVALVLLTQVIKVLNEYERGVVFTFGRFTGVKGPGSSSWCPPSSAWSRSTCASSCSTCRHRT
jgi:regulator of protease activity HflC (stomatin/prohibitin superfamily)